MGGPRIDPAKKEEALAALARGETARSVAARLGFSSASPYAWRRQQRAANGEPPPPRLKNRGTAVRITLSDEARDLLLDIATTWRVSQSRAMERLILEGYERECGQPTDPRDEALELFARLALVLKTREG
jgi:transposase-like protein